MRSTPSTLRASIPASGVSSIGRSAAGRGHARPAAGIRQLCGSSHLPSCLGRGRIRERGVYPLAGVRWGSKRALRKQADGSKLSKISGHQTPSCHGASKRQNREDRKAAICLAYTFSRFRGTRGPRVQHRPRIGLGRRFRRTVKSFNHSID